MGYRLFRGLPKYNMLCPACKSVDLVAVGDAAGEAAAMLRPACSQPLPSGKDSVSCGLRHHGSYLDSLPS